MSQETLVSIIINNYNYGRFLKDAIDSALGQTYRELEVIVVDDGSTDNSREIILRYGDQIIPILKENGGQASAFNAGFVQSHGEIIIFLDSDDMLLPNIVQQVVEIFHAQPDVAKVMYRTEVIDALGMRTGIIKPPGYLPMRSGDLRRYVLAFPFDMTWMATSGNAFAAEILGQIFPMPEQDFRILADTYLSHLTLLFGPVMFLDDIGAYYRIHGSNNYELSTNTLNLTQIRQTITNWHNTYAYLTKFAYMLGLVDQPCGEATDLSVSYIANRLVSLKLDPIKHPIQEDTIFQLFLLGINASLRRFDVSLPVKLLFLLWFAAMVPVPKPIARMLAEKFFFPETRVQLNKFLRVLHHTQ